MQELFTQIKSFLTEAALSVMLNVLFGIVVLILGFILIKWIMKLISKSNAFKKADAGAVKFMTNIISFALKIFLIFTVAIIVGVPAASIITLIGSAGVAIGLALQGSLSNLAGGIMLVFFKPFKVGDFIDSNNGSAGTVTDINVFYTTLVTPDNKILVIPNGILSNEPIVNYSVKEQRRVDFLFGVAYNSDSDKVKEVLLSVANSNEYVLNDPAPAVALNAYKDSAIEFSLKVWCNNANYWDCYFSINEAIKKEFDKNGISIPFPQLEVHNV